MIEEPNLADAVREIIGDKSFKIKDGKVSLFDGTNPPSEVTITTKLTELTAKWEAQEYARNRASAYPSIGDQLDMIYKDTKNSTTTHADAVEVVKTKWPKDNSGPV